MKELYKTIEQQNKTIKRFNRGELYLVPIGYKNSGWWLLIQYDCQLCSFFFSSVELSIQLSIHDITML